MQSMRRLLLLRHAKAERSQPGGRDLERVLTDRGRADARKLGAYVVRHRLAPDLAVVSTAARTRETWRLLSAAFDRPPQARFDERLYNAAPEAILRAIKETAPKIATLLLIGHNPGLHEAAVMLVAAGDVEARQRLGEHFPTAALAVIEFAPADWSRLHVQGGRLEHFVAPRSLTAATD
jgi:phosphohistidine phosphatase